MDKKGYFFKLFLGYLITSELKMHLNQSSNWKEDKLSFLNELQETRFQEKDYVGYFIESPLISSYEISEEQQKLKKKLQHYCPKLNTEKQPVYIFSELFLV